MVRVLSLVLVLVLIGTTSADNSTKEELAKLEGTWTVLSGEADGKPLSEFERPRTITFRGNKAIGLGPDMTFTIDPTKKPKHVTLTTKVPSEEKKEVEVITNAIYTLEKDELTLGIPLVKEGSGTANKRPESFETRDKPIVVLKLIRGQAKKK